MSYRDVGERDEPFDPEATAIAILQKRASRVRAAIHVPLILLGLVAGGLLYTVLRDLQYALRGAHFPWFTAMLAFVPTFGATLRFSPRVADLVVRPLLRRWRVELAKEHGLDLAELEEMTRLLE